MLKRTSGIGPNSEPSVPAHCDAVSSLPNFLNGILRFCTIHAEKSIDADSGKEPSFFSAVGSESAQHLSGPRCRSQLRSQHLGAGNPNVGSSDRGSLFLVLVGKVEGRRFSPIMLQITHALKCRSLICQHIFE